MRMDQPRGSDAATQMVRAIRARALGHGLSVAVRSIASRRWASATFVGTQHHVILDAEPGEALTAWTMSLPEADWAVHGHLVADVVIDSTILSGGVATTTLSILTIEAD